MNSKFSDTYRTSFLTLDRYLQQSNAAQFYFRPLLPPLNTVSGEFYSLSPAQGTDPSIRINKYSSNGTFLGFGYLYDTSFNVPPGGPGDLSGGYWTLTGSNIYNNNPGFVGVGIAPQYNLDVSGITRIQNAGNRSLVIGDTLPPAWTIDDVQIVNNAGESASIIVGTDGSGALRFLNDNSQTYIQSGLDISNNSGCKMNFTRFASQTQTMTVDTSYQYVYVGANIGNAFSGNQFVVDGSGSIQRLTLTGQISFIDVSNGINPVPTQLVVGGVSDRLRIGSSWTGGVSVAGTIQASDFFPDISGGPSTDHGARLLLNPLGGAVAINKTQPGAALDVSGDIVSNHHIPHTSYTYDLGSSSAYWRDLYLSSGTIYMGPSSRIRSSNPLTLDLSGNGGLYITSNTTVGRVYDSAFNPAPGPQTITVLLSNYTVTLSSSAYNVPLASIPAKGNYLIKEEWSFGSGTDMKGKNIYTTIDSDQDYYIMVPAFTMPSSLGASTTYTTFGMFNSGNSAGLTIDTSDINTASGVLSNVTVTVSVLYLSASP